MKEQRDQGPWTSRSVVVWSVWHGCSTIHLPGEFGPCGATEGAKPACNARMGFLTTWTLRFLTNGMEVRKCKRCFAKNGAPRRKYRPEGGWWRFK